MTDTYPCTNTSCPGHYTDGYCDYCGTPNTPTTPAPPENTTNTALPDERAAIVTLGSARHNATRRRVRPQHTRTTGLGAGLTVVPTTPPTPPEDNILTNPTVPENKRHCSTCQTPVGRSHDNTPGNPEGTCPNCGTPYSFTPKLTPGEIVAGQYEITGPLAHGGLGWIYLARDRNVSNRPVVLKGLLNAEDADAAAAAEAEQAFLARVEHPHIVEVYNVVTHNDAGYTVMEHVPGTSLKDILKQRLRDAGGTYNPLPVEHALAYIHGILPAFTYLHDAGMLYCDFKPDNLIHIGDQVKLIDLGGMRAIDDLDSPIYGTIGYQAPEVPDVGPSIASDIYTIGRTLAVLTNEFRGYQTTYATTLPPQDQLPAFNNNDPFYRLVAKACAPDPADRFQSIDELRTQLLGVLRLTVLDCDNPTTAPQSAPSNLFHSPLVTNESLAWWELPALRPDETDPSRAAVASITDTDSWNRLNALRTIPRRTPAVMLAEGWEHLRLHDHTKITTTVEEILAADPWEWRALWLHALSALHRGALQEAINSFTSVYHQHPGEIAPHLGLALAHELNSDTTNARREYLTCLRTDTSYTTAAAFGIARTHIRDGNPDHAIAALNLIPPGTTAHGRAQWLRAELSTHTPGYDALDHAWRSTENLPVTPIERARFRVHLFDTALQRITSTGEKPKETLDGIRITKRAVRLALSDAYRRLATLTPDERERAALIDTANEVRPWTLI
ncbi:Probable serine/threonine-protein kinase pknG [Dermatophilus congolensis]|uniref:non-specific serine/threonine protein kinase n=1 Tax=Dermatophilus congolensis TaxID=1863 RepID=A0AA46BPI1_9MICO|nr:serine/threonine-protein kinase [Dermatophilus congolensis]STD13191.1 Probable serine/threonine-protein kinase pknG [Dermatophilus congolensis]